MTLAEKNWREHLQLASKALSAAEAAPARTAKHGGAHGARAQALQRTLLDEARKNLTAARVAILSNVTQQSALPGLPGSAVRPAESVPSAQKAITDAWNALAELATLRGDADTGVESYRRALELSPQDALAHAQLAQIFEGRHKVQEATAHAEQALRVNPGNATANVALARIFLRQGDFDAAERAARVVVHAPGVSTDHRALAWMLVGEARDRRDDAAAAFEAFKAGNETMRRRYGSLQFRSHPAHPANVRSLTDIIEHLNLGASSRPSSVEAPAFLLGFPRSGTTLLEQILSAHSRVFCLGETDYLFEALSVVLREGDLFERVAALGPDEIDIIRTAYRDLVLKDHPEARGKIIVDKHPLHIALLPLIHKVFPDAKIMLAVRDPRDVVLSCYQQCFSINVATLEFLDLQRTAGYFDAVMNLMLTCRDKLRIHLHEVRYRDVVANLEREARRLAHFLDVPFEPAMLLFHEHARSRTITSASARQVINPIYMRSISRWRLYEKQLAPALPLLNKWARRLGYEE